MKNAPWVLVGSVLSVTFALQAIYYEWVADNPLKATLCMAWAAFAKLVSLSLEDK